MNWEIVGITMAFMALGYLIGSVSFSIIITKLLGLDDVRKKGSGNAGATNTLRNYGVKVGLVVFILDVSKTIIAMIIPFYLFPDDTILALVGLAVILGHIWPIFHGLKGGKGAATLLGMIIMINWLLALIGFILFMALVLYTKKVSLGSTVVPGLILVFFIAFQYIPNMSDTTFEPFVYIYPWGITAIVYAIAWLLVVYKHKENIKRLIAGTENNFTKKK